MLESLKDLWRFLKVRKKYWLVPIVIVLLIVGSLLMVTEGSVITPFVYSLF